LSIEGYQVTEELIARGAINDWNPNDNPQDAESRNAMAARGYYLAHQAVRAPLRRILSGEDAATVVDADHGGWYRQLFAPSVTAGLRKASDLAGYRNAPIYVKNATHVPPQFTAAREIMPALFALLAAERYAAVRAVHGWRVLLDDHGGDVYGAADRVCAAPARTDQAVSGAWSRFFLPFYRQHLGRRVVSAATWPALRQEVERSAARRSRSRRLVSRLAIRFAAGGPQPPSW